ncbi:MAG: prolyl oligopeptidase family serine peptidase [Pseudomonadota bacterium]
MGPMTSAAVEHARRVFAMFVVTLCCIGSAVSQDLEERFSLDTALQAQSLPSAGSGVEISKDTDFLAWIDSGDLRIARQPDFVPQTVLKRDEVGPIRFIYPSRDGETIFFIRGRSIMSFGDLSKQDDRELWSVHVPTGQRALIARGDDVPEGPIERNYFGARAKPNLVFAPAGDAFAFAEGNALFEFRRSEDGSWRRKQLLDSEPQHMAGKKLSGIAYSPDGSKIAFTSTRKARQSFVAVVDLDSGKTRYLQPGFFKDDAPVWSPDSSRLAFMRLPGNWPMTYRFTTKSEGAPWSIMLADIENGKVDTLWTADPGPGSVNSASPMFWTEDGRILFRWEKTGWHRLYAVSAAGGEPVLLTPGKGEVSMFDVSPDGRTLAYASNSGDLARRHVWILDLSTGENNPLTAGEGVEDLPRYTAGGHLTYFETYRPDGAPRLMAGNGEGDASPVALLTPQRQGTVDALWSEFSPVQVLWLKARDGVESPHVLIMPSSPPPPEGYPVIVQAHGGPATQTLPGGGYFTFGQYLASQGYLYVSMNYRGGTGLGLSYRNAAGAGADGGSEWKDLAALASYLKGRNDVNGARIGIFGVSYGGHIVGQAMSRLPKDYAVGVSHVGVADWVVELKKDSEDQGWMSAPTEYMSLSERLRIEDLAHASSPTSRIENWQGPILFTLGELDRAGHMESAIDLGYRLLEKGDVTVEFYVDPAGGHRAYHEQAYEFFKEHL